MSETFTIDELLAVLVGAQKDESVAAPGAYTMDQLRKILGGRSVVYVAGLLRPHIDSGRVECVRVPFTRIDGVRTTIPGYRLAEGWESGDAGDGGDEY